MLLDNVSNVHVCVCSNIKSSFCSTLRSFRLTYMFNTDVKFKLSTLSVFSLNVCVVHDGIGRGEGMFQSALYTYVQQTNAEKLEHIGIIPGELMWCIPTI